MRRLLTASLALAAFGLCCVPVCLAQEKVAAPAKVEAAHADHCGAACLEKVCVPTPTKIKISKVQYKCKESDICLPRCTLGGHGGLGLGGRCGRCGHGHGCDDDDIQCPPEEHSAQCGHPRTVRVLMKRTVTKDCPSIKCEVKEQPAQPRCGRGHDCCADTCVTVPAGAAAPVVPGATMPRAIIETAPRPLPAAGAPAFIIEPQR